MSWEVHVPRITITEDDFEDAWNWEDYPTYKKLKERLFGNPKFQAEKR